MKGVWFYEDFCTPRRKRRGDSCGNCIAVFVEPHSDFAIGDMRKWYPQVYFDSQATAYVPTVSAIFCEPNSDVMGSSASVEYLRQCCKRVPERRVREIHPKLIEYLEAE